MKRISYHAGFAAVATACALASGCANMAGVGGTTQYSCKAPEGVKCDSVSGTYHNSVEHNLPSQRQGSSSKNDEAAPVRFDAPGTNRGSAQTAEVPTALATIAVRSGVAPPRAAHAPMPLRSPARVLRLWVKPWEDSDGDLVDQFYVYVPIDHGRWLVDHAQRRIRDTYAPVRAPRAALEARSDDREGAKADPRVPAGSVFEQRLQAARGQSSSVAHANGAHDGR